MLGTLWWTLFRWTWVEWKPSFLYTYCFCFDELHKRDWVLVWVDRSDVTITTCVSWCNPVLCQNPESHNSILSVRYSFKLIPFKIFNHFTVFPREWKNRRLLSVCIWMFWSYFQPRPRDSLWFTISFSCAKGNAKCKYRIQIHFWQNKPFLQEDAI